MFPYGLVQKTGPYVFLRTTEIHYDCTLSKWLQILRTIDDFIRTKAFISPILKYQFLKIYQIKLAKIKIRGIFFLLLDVLFNKAIEALN